jgi:mannitol operon transcriptional antiterminator
MLALITGVRAILCLGRFAHDMNVSSRTRQILELLLSSDRDLTAAEIATRIRVSSRTVHRELASAEELLHAHGIELLKKSGSGIRLRGEEVQIGRAHV